MFSSPFFLMILFVLFYFVYLLLQTVRLQQILQQQEATLHEYYKDQNGEMIQSLTRYKEKSLKYPFLLSTIPSTLYPPPPLFSRLPSSPLVVFLTFVTYGQAYKRKKEQLQQLTDDYNASIAHTKKLETKVCSC